VVFSISSRTYVHLTLRLTMRRILATLAVVGALLFSAGSARADFDGGVAAAQRGDYATAFREFLPLAEQGNRMAQTNLGFMYATGTGVPKNIDNAYMWFSLPKAQGDETAAGFLDILKTPMTPSQITKAQARDDKLWEKHHYLTSL
jgi:hypothetical protein